MRRALERCLLNAVCEKARTMHNISIRLRLAKAKLTTKKNKLAPNQWLNHALGYLVLSDLTDEPQPQHGTDWNWTVLSTDSQRWLQQQQHLHQHQHQQLQQHNTSNSNNNNSANNKNESSSSSNNIKNAGCSSYAENKGLSVHGLHLATQGTIIPPQPP